MFNALKEFNNIIVSGPQRSGTRIGAKIIAHDTGKKYIDEADLNFHDFRLLNYYLNKGNIVVQCPGLCHMLHFIIREDTLIIIMRRSIEDIMLSESRKWSSDSRKLELVKYGYSSGIISTIKYDFWDSYQKPILGAHARSINYDQLKDHPMFVSDRKSFLWNQTHKES